MDARDPVTVEEIYGYGTHSPSEIDATLDRSRNPRSADSLYETFGAQGVGPDHVILDIGARDAAQTLELVSRLGYRAVAFDPVKRNLSRRSGR